MLKITAPERYEKRLEYESKGDPIRKNLLQIHSSEIGIDTITNYDIELLNDPQDNIENELWEKCGILL